MFALRALICPSNAHRTDLDDLECGIPKMWENGHSAQPDQQLCRFYRIPFHQIEMGFADYGMDGWLGALRDRWLNEIEPFWLVGLQSHAPRCLSHSIIPWCQHDPHGDGLRLHSTLRVTRCTSSHWRSSTWQESRKLGTCKIPTSWLSHFRGYIFCYFGTFKISMEAKMIQWCQWCGELLTTLSHQRSTRKIGSWWKSVEAVPLKEARELRTKQAEIASRLQTAWALDRPVASRGIQRALEHRHRRWSPQMTGMMPHLFWWETSASV